MVTDSFIKQFEALKKENQDLKERLTWSDKNLQKAVSHKKITNGKIIDCGIGEIGISFSGSIDLIELINELEMCIKGNGIKDTIRILAMAK